MPVATEQLFTRVEQLPVREVLAEDTVLEHLHDMLVHDIPGFIMRHEGEIPGVVDAGRIHRRNVAAVRRGIQAFHPHKRVVSRHFRRFTGLGQKEEGGLHNHMRVGGMAPGASLTEPLVHTTLEGGGDFTWHHREPIQKKSLETPYIVACIVRTATCPNTPTVYYCIT